MQDLLEIGFVKSGHWLRTEKGIEHRIELNADAANVLYSFISDGEVLYIGKTVRRLKRRMYGYQNPGISQTTNVNVNGRIRELLNAGRNVDIYVLPDNGLLHFGIFHLNLAAGLEDSIISKLRPVWNRKGRS